MKHFIEQKLPFPFSDSWRVKIDGIETPFSPEYGLYIKGNKELLLLKDKKNNLIGTNIHFPFFKNKEAVLCSIFPDPYISHK